jgi:predicted N-acetyltransferase YhbS
MKAAEMQSAAESWSEFRLRLAEANDTDALVRLINAAFIVEKGAIEGDRINSKKLQALFGTGKILLLEDAGEVIGCVYIEITNRRGYLGLLAVQPGRQKSGLGRRLVASAEDYLRKNECEWADLRIVSARSELPPIYKRLGYVATGTAPIPDTISLKVPSHFVLMSKRLK